MFQMYPQIVKADNKSLTAKINNKYTIEIDKNLNVSGSDELNQDFTKMFKKVFEKIKDIKVIKLELLGKEANYSRLNFKIGENHFKIDLNWEYTKALNEIAVPYSNGFKAGNFFDKKILSVLLKEASISNFEDKAISHTKLLVFLQAILMNRMFFVFTLIQNFYILYVEKELHFKTITKSFNTYFHNKLLTFTIKARLQLNGLLDLKITLKVDNKIFILNDKNGKLSLPAIKDSLEYVLNKKLTYKMVNIQEDPLITIKNRLFIVNTQKAEHEVFMYHPLNSYYIDGYGYKYDLNNMEMVEVYTLDEIIEMIKQYLINEVYI